METLKSELVGVIWALLPGFAAAWIYYGLTAHRKQSQFERTLQALVFTAIVLPLVLLTKLILGWLSTYLVFGAWDGDVQATWGVIYGIGLGLAMSYYANNSKVHSWLSEKKITKRTSFPSEWFSAFELDQRYVLLHLEDGRRLYGWPYENPDHSDVGHFVLMQPEWILPDNTRAPINTTHRVLVPANKVLLVEFDKDPHEYTHDRGKHEETVQKLVDLNKKEKAKDAESESKDGSSNGQQPERAPEERVASSADGEQHE